MHQFRKQLLILSIAIGLLTTLRSSVSASPIQVTETFATAGTVDSQGVSGSPAVRFQGADAGNLTTGVPFALGRFLGNSTSNTSTTYTQTPFQITFQILSNADGVTPSSQSSPIVLDGWLNGTVRGSDLSNLHVNFDLIPVPDSGAYNLLYPYPFSAPPFRTGDLLNFLNVTDWGQQGQPILSELNTIQTVPEPSALGALVVLICLVVRNYRRSDPTWK